MNQKPPFLLTPIALLGIGGLLLTLSSTLFTVHETQQILVTRWGKPVHSINEPGLKAKLPWIDETQVYDKRLLGMDLSVLEVTLGDRRRIVADAFCRYRISDPLKFYQSVRDENGLQSRLKAIVLGSLRSVLGHQTLQALLSDERARVMREIRDRVNQDARQFGVDVVDVRIRRTDLPAQNSESIFKRMISEREREARELRAKGAEQAKVIISSADRDRIIALAEAEKEAAEQLAQGESQANKVMAEAFGKDPEFFAMISTMNAYREALKPDNTTYIVSSKGRFFRFMNQTEK